MEVSQSMSEYLLKSKLSPCVQIINRVESNYIWNGLFKKSSEHIILIKCKSKKLKEISTYIQENHNYDTPEIIALDIDILNDNYRKWFDENC